MVWKCPGFGKVQDGLGQIVWKGPEWSGRVKEGLGGSIMVWEGPGLSRMVQTVLVAPAPTRRYLRVQDVLGGSKTVQEGPRWSGRVQDGLGGSKMIWEGPKQSARIHDSMIQDSQEHQQESIYSDTAKCYQILQKAAKNGFLALLQCVSQFFLSTSPPSLLNIFCIYFISELGGPKNLNIKEYGFIVLLKSIDGSSISSRSFTIIGII